MNTCHCPKCGAELEVRVDVAVDVKVKAAKDKKGPYLGGLYTLDTIGKMNVGDDICLKLDIPVAKYKGEPMNPKINQYVVFRLIGLYRFNTFYTKYTFSCRSILFNSIWGYVPGLPFEKSRIRYWLNVPFCNALTVAFKELKENYLIENTTIPSVYDESRSGNETGIKGDILKSITNGVPGNYWARDKLGGDKQGSYYITDRGEVESGPVCKENGVVPVFTLEIFPEGEQGDDE
jgi:hypothetical protein